MKKIVVNDTMQQGYTYTLNQALEGDKTPHCPNPKTLQPRAI